MTMQAIKCELCGSGELIKKDSMFVCQHCGTKYTVEEARKLLGTVKIDKSDIKENNRTLARRAMQIGEYSEALRYYDILLSEEPNNWEAYFFCALCKALSNNDPEYEEKYAASLNKSIPITIQLIANHEEDPEEQETALFWVLDNLDKYINTSSKCATDFYSKNRKKEGLLKPWIQDKMVAYVKLFNTYEKAVQNYFPGMNQVIDEAKVDRQVFFNNNKRSFSWKQRSAISKNQ